MICFRHFRAHKSQDFLRTPSARRSRRSLRSGYAFAHQEGFGKLITSGKIMRKTGLNFGSKSNSNNAANNNSGSSHNVSTGQSSGLASGTDQTDGILMNRFNYSVISGQLEGYIFLLFIQAPCPESLTTRRAKPTEVCNPVPDSLKMVAVFHLGVPRSPTPGRPITTVDPDCRILTPSR